MPLLGSLIACFSPVTIKILLLRSIPGPNVQTQRTRSVCLASSDCAWPEFQTLCAESSPCEMPEPSPRVGRAPSHVRDFEEDQQSPLPVVPLFRAGRFRP